MSILNIKPAFGQQINRMEKEKTGFLQDSGEGEEWMNEDL